MFATDNPNIIALAKLLETLPHAIQIRFFPTLEDRVKTIVGEDAIIYIIVTNDLSAPEKFRTFQSAVPSAVYNNPENHAGFASHVGDVLTNYVETGFIPYNGFISAKDTGWIANETTKMESMSTTTFLSTSTQYDTPPETQEPPATP